MKRSVRKLIYRALENELDARQKAEFEQLVQNDPVREAYQQGLALREGIAQCAGAGFRLFFAERVTANWHSKNTASRLELLNSALAHIFRRVALASVICIVILGSLNFIYNNKITSWDNMLKKGKVTLTEIISSEFGTSWEDLL